MLSKVWYHIIAVCNHLETVIVKSDDIESADGILRNNEIRQADLLHQKE